MSHSTVTAVLQPVLRHCVFFIINDLKTKRTHTHTHTNPLQPVSQPVELISALRIPTLFSH